MGGLALLLAGIVLYSLPASAATDGVIGPSWQYTQHPARVSTGRTVSLYIDRDFTDPERRQIVTAISQWNYALNGALQFRAALLADNPSPGMLQQIRRSGGWIVARVDSRHPIAHTGEGAHALAVTAGGQGGFVYVIDDRIGSRSLVEVVLHELGHVLGAPHSRAGLMAPVYDPRTTHCIDHEAAALVASAQRLPLQQLNWCVGPAVDPRPTYSMRR